MTQQKGSKENRMYKWGLRGTGSNEGQYDVMRDDFGEEGLV